MSLRPFLAVFLASLVSAPAVARAAGLAPALVRALARPGRAHPLADERGNVPLSVVLPPGVDAAALGLAPVAPGIGAIRLAPDAVAPFAAAHPGLAIGVSPRLHPLLDVSGTWTHVDAFRKATNGLDGKGVVVGVVDTGLDVRHPDFRTKDGHTRVAWMLVHDKPKGLHPDLEQAFGCTDPTTPCAIYAAADIDAVIATSDDELRDKDGHGTHVSSIAAGNGGPSVTAKPRYVGLAPEATLIVAAPSSDGEFVDTDILNGARFVFDRADAMGMPAVLNLSLGSDYGSHDGTSALEKGLMAFVGDDKPGHAIVVAAGNSGELTSAATFCPASIASECAALPPLGIHTEVHVDDGEVVRVPMLATNAAQNGEVFVWLTFRPGDDIAVGLEGPCGATWVGLTGKNDENGYTSGSNGASIVNDLPNADADLTADTNSAIIDFSGAWGAQSTCGGASVDTEFAVRLRGHGDASLWITTQKDAVGGMAFERALRPGTVNVPASAPGLLAVGCTVNRVEWKPLGEPAVVLGELADDMNPVADSACYFSSSGPTPFGVEKPEISAPGGFVAAAMSADADPRKNKDPGGLFDLGGCPSGDAFCAVVDPYHALASGTSMSSPQVAGAIALLMGIDPTLTQARATAVLQAGARLSKGHVPDPNQLGPGSLDVEGARVALLESMTAPTAADPSKSWYSLSSAYARPDPTWPVWGTIELRTSDGTTAVGVDGDLRLSLTGGGKVYQPITRVRPGLFRFAVAGLPRDLGQTIQVEVTQAGVSLGARALPVGWDTWSANDPSVAAVGACQASPRSSAPRIGLMLLVLAVAAGARRRRHSAG